MPKKTSQKERLRQFEALASRLRLAQICMNNELAVETVHAIVSLNRKFEYEDNPPMGR